MVPESLVEVSSGEDIILKCQASGNPIPKIKWMKKEKEISLENHLKISNSKPIDQGVYECIASNEIGRAIKEIKVIIKGGILDLNNDLEKLENDFLKKVVVEARYFFANDVLKFH